MERVDIIGGGPGGLVLAILLRRWAIADDVRVFERSAQDNTYGWAVVFPEGALNELARTDPETFRAISEAGVDWSPIDIRFKQIRWCIQGNRFQGIARTTLLAILHDIATGLGVKVHYNNEVSGLGEHHEADLVVGADGLNSVVRQQLSEQFAPEIEHSSFKYRWLGVRRRYPYFTYIFQQTEWGLLQGYCYPSDQEWSSLIVFASERTWRESGLADMDDAESVRLCEEVFAEHLEGAPILSQGSRWTNFPHLRCGTWHHGNVVLIGDAAHTAHWSIGSGTRLAISDAIELARQLSNTSVDTDTTLARFESSRRPAVEKFQDAARSSEWYFENVHQYLDFEPIQFVYQLMARSWRVTHGHMARTDPDFVAEFDGWFHGKATGVPVQIAPPPAFAPVRIGRVHLRNRVVTDDGRTGGALAISPSFPADDLDIPPAHSAQVASSADAVCLRLVSDESGWLADGLGERAGKLGYDLLLLDLSDSPVDDSQRATFERLVAGCPQGLPVAVALTLAASTEWAAEATVARARSFRAAGADVVLVRAGLDCGYEASQAPRVAQVSAAIRNGVGVPVIVDGIARNLDELNTIVAAGWADLGLLTPHATKEGQSS